MLLKRKWILVTRQKGHINCQPTCNCITIPFKCQFVLNCDICRDGSVWDYLNRTKVSVWKMNIYIYIYISKNIEEDISPKIKEEKKGGD